MRTNTAKGSHEVANRDLGKVEIDCRKAAPKEEQIGKSANQMSGSERVNIPSEAEQKQNSY